MNQITKFFEKTPPIIQKLSQQRVIFLPWGGKKNLCGPTFSVEISTPSVVGKI